MIKYLTYIHDDDKLYIIYMYIYIYIYIYRRENISVGMWNKKSEYHRYT
jgi:hypothetical protein